MRCHGLLVPLELILVYRMAPGRFCVPIEYMNWRRHLS